MHRGILQSSYPVYQAFPLIFKEYLLKLCGIHILDSKFFG